MYLQQNYMFREYLVTSLLFPCVDAEDNVSSKLLLQTGDLTFK